MRKIVYDVAMTLDGFICHRDGSIDGFFEEGDHVGPYQERLKTYDTVVMGRKTYEFGFQYGLPPGARAYPHMEHYIFSSKLKVDGGNVKIIAEDPVPVLRELKEQNGSDIYLCGGGQFAGHLLDHGLIDRWVVKLNPVIFGAGVRAFEGSQHQAQWSLTGSTAYESGVTLLEYDICSPVTSE